VTHSLQFFCSEQSDLVRKADAAACRERHMSSMHYRQPCLPLLCQRPCAARQPACWEGTPTTPLRHCAADTIVVLWGSSAALDRSQEELRGDRIPP
jgi:hypothetical protein